MGLAGLLTQRQIEIKIQKKKLGSGRIRTKDTKITQEQLDVAVKLRDILVIKEKHRINGSISEVGNGVPSGDGTKRSRSRGLEVLFRLIIVPSFTPTIDATAEPLILCTIMTEINGT